jgi:hypothetical protein
VYGPSELIDIASKEHVPFESAGMMSELWGAILLVAGFLITWFFVLPRFGFRT